MSDSLQKVIEENPYPHYSFVAQNAEVERERATKYARTLLRLSALAAQQPQQGYVLVPREPTPGMNQAGYRAMRANATAEQLSGMTAECEIYRAMLAAAPSAPVQPEQPVATIYGHADIGETFSNEDWKRIEALPVGAKLYTHQAAQPADVEALRREIARLEAALLEADSEQQRADAERYRWLRSQHYFDNVGVVYWGVNDEITPEQVDAAIDAAITAESGRGEA